MTILQPQPVGIPRPTPSPLTRPFWDGCAAGELRYQRCNACNRPIFDPATLCRNCGNDQLRWERSEGYGQVYSWSAVYQPPEPSFNVPYIVAIIELAEGYFMLSNVVGCELDDVRLGMDVEVIFHSVEEGFVLPLFQPRGGPTAD